MSKCNITTSISHDNHSPDNTSDAVNHECHERNVVLVFRMSESLVFQCVRESGGEDGCTIRHMRRLPNDISLLYSSWDTIFQSSSCISLIVVSIITE